MGRLSMDRSQTTYVDAILRDELARGNRALRGVAPVIAHLLDSDGAAVVSDAIVARLRGMLSDLAAQLMRAAGSDHAENDKLAEILAGDESLIDHLYALAMEGHLTDRLEVRDAIDPVLSPLLQELIASDQPPTAELAMTALAAQSRFCQSQRRMELPIGELPPHLFAGALERFETAQLDLDRAQVEEGLSALRREYDEAAGRISLLARLVASMRGGALAALDIGHAGVALFASALASLTRQERDLALFACHERQAVRLALSLRAAGAEPALIESQLAVLGGTQALPSGIADMPQDHARELLASDSLSEPAFAADAS